MTSADISVVVQGAIDRRRSELGGGAMHTIECLTFIKRVLPNAELIYSGWELDDEVAKLCDVVLANKDPGPLTTNASEKNFLDNINRQIVSTREGVKLASRKYVIKIRSDSWLENSAVLDTLASVHNGNKGEIFEKPIILCALGCADPTRWPAPFHLSDLFQIGLKSDMELLWNADLCPSAWASWHKGKTGVSDWKRGGEGKRPERIAPEQYLYINLLHRTGRGFDLPDSILGGGGLTCMQSERHFIQNFSPQPSARLGLVLPSRLRVYDNAKHFSYRSDWVVVNWLRSNKSLVSIYVIARCPLFWCAKWICILKHIVRPYIGARAKKMLTMILDLGK